MILYEWDILLSSVEYSSFDFRWVFFRWRKNTAQYVDPLPCPQWDKTPLITVFSIYKRVPFLCHYLPFLFKTSFNLSKLHESDMGCFSIYLHTTKRLGNFKGVRCDGSKLHAHRRYTVPFLALQTFLPQSYKCPKQERCKGILQDSARKIGQVGK